MQALAGLGPSKTAKKSQILLVDDEPEVLLALEDVLADDYEVLKANSPRDALNIAEHQPDIAVVISDQRMPGMTGDELLARLSTRFDATRVMVTGYADLRAVIRAVNRGKIFAYVTKPWDPAELQLIVQRSVEHFDLLRKLSSERQLLDDLINNIPDAVFFKDRDLRFQRVNRACAARLALTDVTHAVGKRLVDLGIPPETACALEEDERLVLVDGRTATDIVRRHERPEGRRFYSTSLAAVRTPSDSIHGLVGISRDVTARQETERALQRLTHVRAIQGGVNAAIVRVKDREALLREVCRIAVEDGGLLVGAVVSLDKNSERMTSTVSHGIGCNLSQELVNAWAKPRSGEIWTLAELVSGRLPVIVNDLAAQAETALARELLRSGGQAVGLFPLIADERVAGVLVLVAPQPDFFDGQEVRLLSELADNIASALAHIEKSNRLAFLAYYDDITGLPKRELLMDRLHQLLPGRLTHEGRLAVLLVDISRFRHVNDTFGRGAGNELLVQVANRLSQVMAERDTLARFDSNAFALVLNAPGEESELVAWAQKAIFGSLNAPFTVRGTELRIAVRVGAAMFPSDAADADGLVRNAEAALGNAKATGQTFLFYAPSMNARVSERLTLETKLWCALAANQFLLHYQPKVDLRSGSVVGLEALIRWNDPERGLVAPAQFIPVLEETGLILDVGSWVLDRAALQYAEWVEQGLAPPRIAVNVSAIQLTQRGFVQSIEQVLDKHPAARGHLDIELTESVLMQDLQGNIDKLRALKEQGVRIAIDDFGTGYSSLGYLSRLPIDTLKIDRSFVIRMAEDAQEMTIVTTIISLAHSLDMKVIAEGVETTEQARLLRLVLCDEIQGYLVGRPQDAAEVTGQFRAEHTSWPVRAN